MKRLLLILTLSIYCITNLQAQSISEKTKGMTEMVGFFDIYSDEENGKVFLKVDQFEKEFLYANFLVTGIGSNDIGLDRGQIGDNRVVYFKEVGNKVFLIQPNQDYRAITKNEAEKKSVRQAFAESVLAGFEIIASSNNEVLIDMTSFLVQDVHGVIGRLRSSNQGSYSLDKSKSSVWFDVLKAFPKNIEMESLITLKGNPKGSEIYSVTPTANLISYRVRHSFLELPDDNFTPVEMHPRSGYFGMSYQDYSTPIEEPLVKRFIRKHRLERKNPGTAPSEAIEPIIYYVDNGTPEPIRSALVEGASWWNQAFEAAGFINAFQVKVLPDDADPLDARYNVIQWVHRSTRGWSYGASIVDPRTGEIIKGHVSLGSLRVRQDYLIATALLSPFNENFDSENNPMIKLALARLRQLSAHEVGHTIGLAHNFAASTKNRASVMDYPHPLVSIKDNQIVFDEAYDTGIGEWDKIAITYGYVQNGNESANKQARLDAIKKADEMNIPYITDRDARAQGGAHPKAHLWDNGTTASDELNRVLEIRKLALDNFSIEAIEQMKPVTTLQDVLVPLYYFHRYQVEASVKNIGGAEYTYAVRGDSDITIKPVSKKQQLAALESLMKSMSADNLMLKKETLAILNPRTPGYYNRRELFDSKTNPMFDPLAIAEAQIGFTLGLLFHPARIERVVQQHMLNASLPSFDDIYTKPVKSLWLSLEDKDAYKTELNRLVATHYLQQLIVTTQSKRVSISTRNRATHAVNEIEKEFFKLLNKKKKRKEANASLNDAIRIIKNYRDNPSAIQDFPISDMPPGSPIGSCGMDYSLN